MTATHPSPTARRHPIRIALGVIVVLILLAALGILLITLVALTIGSTEQSDAAAPAMTAIEQARNDYLDTLQGQQNQTRVYTYATIGDDGRSMILDGESDSSAQRNAAGAQYRDGLKVDDLANLLYGLNIPDAVIGRMENTRALDGTQTAEWDGLEASWTYHPDNGLDVIINEK